MPRRTGVSPVSNFTAFIFSKCFPESQTPYGTVRDILKMETGETPVLRYRSSLISRGGKLGRHLAHLPQIQLAGAEQREIVHAEKSLGARFPEIRQVALRQFLQTRCQPGIGQLVQHDEPFALRFVRQAGDNEHLFGRIGQLVQFFLDLDVRHHFAADFAEAVQPVGDLQETVLVERRDVAGAIPAIAQHLGGFSGLPR